MLLKKILLLLFITVTIRTVSGQFVIAINKTTGGISQISNPDDKHQMNWIFASGDSNLTWQKPNQDWGLGKYDVAELEIRDESWTTPAKQLISGNKSILLYKTRCMDIRVERVPVGKDYIETYSFVNTTGKKLSISGLNIYTPFNDNYPDAIISATKRCNAHIWPGMHSSYVNAIRMNGEGSHLGLVFTRGALSTYSVENRDIDKKVPWKYSASNVRGTLVFNIAPFVLEATGTYTVQWKLFWHNGWDDFYTKAINAGFVKLSAPHYVISQNENLTINIEAKPMAGIKNKAITLSAKSIGEHSQKIFYDKGRKHTVLNYLVISSPQNLIDRRVKFIVENQQMNDPKDGRYGAYMVYDTELGRIFDNPVNTVSNADRNEGRERLGMGVLIAKWLQYHPNENIRNSLMRYVKFIREKLQAPDYKVYSNIVHTHHHRMYNYPWVAHLYLETYQLTKDKKYLSHFYGTMRKYYQVWGVQHYSIDFRVADGLAALDEAGMKAEKDSLLYFYTKTGDFFAETGIHYPKHEVNYEQSIVAPAVSFLCEMYQVTKNEKYLTAAKIQLQSLEAFNGRQPDVHLNEIGIRHWDGYWFGKKSTWGDVMPHHWSTLTALAFHKYYQCTGDAGYEEKAKKIVENNLLNFRENGMASCAYLYPSFINNQPGKFYDPFANDQDWALVFYLEIIRPLP